MAEEAAKTEPSKESQKEIRFRCQRCEKQRPLTDMRSVTRFLPVLIVCKDCAQGLR